MKYCRRCIIPDTRPNIRLDEEGVCNACRSHEKKASIDWEERRRQFLEVARNAKKRSTGYDCLIPVSGGKDSHWQVITCLEHGLRPLTVTWQPPSQTEIGRQNLENLISLGVDHLALRVNPSVEKKFIYEALKQFGSTAVPMHLAIFSLPLRCAVQYGIPLVVWGENSAFEYGDKSEADTGFRLDGAWMKTYGVTHGTTAADWVSPTLSAAELQPYTAPSEHALTQAGTIAVFLGYYFEWDPEKSLTVASARGFRANSVPRTGYYAYADIDDDFISVHHFLKWYKFGMTRAFDNLSLEIRHGRMTRDAAISEIEAQPDPVPHEDIAKLCRYLNITEPHFFEVIEKFRNPAIWKHDGSRWHIPDFLVSTWEWK